MNKTTKQRMIGVAAMLSLGGWLPTLAHADLQRLNERQLAQVQGRAPIDARQLYANFVGPWVVLSQQSVSGLPQTQDQKLQFDASQWLSVFGLHYDGPSMGTISLQGVDTRGLEITLQSRP